MSQVVPDATEHSHMQLTELMKADAARQEPLTTVIGAMLEETVVRNDLKQRQSSLPAFTGRRPPLSASAFVARIAKYSGASPCCYAIGLIYLERMKKRDPGLYLNSTNFQRLFLVSTMTAAKFLDDFYYSNKHWAQIGGITTKELNCLELEFLFRMGFSLHMQREEYDWYAEELLSRVDAAPTQVPPATVCSEATTMSAPLCSAQGSSISLSARSMCSSSDENEALLSSHTTPMSSASHIPHDSYAKVGVPMNGMCPVGMPVAMGSSAAAGIVLPIPLDPYHRSLFDVSVAPAAPANMHSMVSQGVSVAMPIYNPAIPQAPWVYY